MVAKNFRIIFRKASFFVVKLKKVAVYWSVDTFFQLYPFFKGNNDIFSEFYSHAGMSECKFFIVAGSGQLVFICDLSQRNLNFGPNVIKENKTIALNCFFCF
jgi:hypothetical protein